MAQWSTTGWWLRPGTWFQRFGNALVPPGMRADEWRLVMLDAVLLVIGCGFFVVAVLYTVACDRI